MLLVFLFLGFVCRRDVRAQLTGGSDTKGVGDTAILPCKLTRKLAAGESLEQISWQKRTKQKPETYNFLTIKEGGVNHINGQDHRFQHIGSFADHNGTLQLSNVNLNDDGIYTCIFSIFPTGTPRTEIPLTVFVPPQRSVKDTVPTLGDKEVPLATCTAAGFNPPAEVKWKTDAVKHQLRWINNSTLHTSGATTTVSTLFGKPTKKMHRGLVQCIISEKENWTLPFELQIYYPPLEVKIEKMKDLIFTCKADANPNATITWSRSGRDMPPSVTFEGAVLSLKEWTSDLNGLYQCEAMNLYGSKQSSIYVDIKGDTSIGGWIAFLVLLVLVLVLVAAVFLYKKGYLTLPRFFQPVPTSSPEEPESGNGSPKYTRGRPISSEDQL